MYYVYQHINKINGKRYIGITKQNPESRWGTDGANYKSSPYFYSAIQKYGWDNFSHEILFNGLTKEEACDKEIELIAYFQTQDKQHGYNIMEGGSTPVIPEEVRKLMSEKMRGNKNVDLIYNCILVNPIFVLAFERLYQYKLFHLFYFYVDKLCT